MIGGLPFDDLIDKKEPVCFPNKLQKFRPPLVPSDDFPSRVFLIKNEQSTGEEKQDGEGDNFTNISKDKKEKKAPITYWRRAEHTDENTIIDLIDKSGFIMNDLFGEPDVPYLIEQSSFSIVQFNSNQELISFTSSFSHPNIPAVPSFEWFPWLESLYRIKDVNPRNAFFIHYMVWDKDYYEDFLRLTLETMFLEFTFLNNIIITKPPNVKIPNIISQTFIQVLPRDAKIYDCDSNSLQTILVCLRHSLMERLKIRLAIVEDHDDLMPIVEQQTDRLKALYGNYCMAEIIEFPGTTDRKTLVCESMGYAVGFMSVNRAIDFELLNSQFDLGVFHGLRKPNKEDKLKSDLNVEEKEQTVYLPDKIDPFYEILDSEGMLKFLNWKPSLCASEEDFASVSDSSTIKGYNELSSSMSDFLKETLNVKLVPKFTAHALSLTTDSTDEDTVSLTSPFSRPTIDSVSVEESFIQSEMSQISLQHYNLPIYNGPPNAFCIEFYAMHSNFDDRLCLDFLEAAFEVFPDLEYCILTIPSQSPTFPLLDFFTRVSPRPLKRFKQELYVCHKSSVMITFMRVRRILKSDLPEIKKLLNGIQNKEFIYADIASSCFYEDSAYQAFVLICSNSIVGAAVLCNEYGMDYLAHHFHVSDLIDFDLHRMEYHAILKHLVLNPIYDPHARFFLKDLMRMADVTSLYRTRYEEAEINWNTSSLITVLGHLIPVKPRRMVKYHEPSLGPNIPPPYFLQSDIPFSLYHINARVCGLKKHSSNINVVIVGTSRTAFSFLENILFGPSSAYVTYNNITWVSPHGIGTELPSHPSRDLMFPFRGRYSKYYKTQMCLKTYVNFVYGVMTEINRVDKYIRINNDSILPYDYLILLCGRQFVMPIPYVSITEAQICRRSCRPRCTLFKYLTNMQTNKDETTNNLYPPNVFLINTEVDATNALISLQYLIYKFKGSSYRIIKYFTNAYILNTNYTTFIHAFKPIAHLLFDYIKVIEVSQILSLCIKVPEDEKIIIYGHHISSYLCLQALLEFGIPGKTLAVVEPLPFGVETVSCFVDNNIDTAVLTTIKELNIDHYRGYSLYDWSLCKNGQICTATFHSQHRRVTMKCLAMFPFERKTVSEVTFKAVNEASLVYDGRLVINNCFQTNDKYIYAAGSLTKYQRKYYAKNKNHRYYSSIEIGKHLARILIKKIDPTEPEETPEQKLSDLVPELESPVLLYGILPGGWNYFTLRKPGKPTDPETQGRIKEFGDVLTTGDCNMTNGRGYFKLTLDDYGFIKGVTCYTKDSIDVENLEMLYGKHEKLLNDLLLRFDLGLITDFYSYFREPWAYAIFHDRFHLVLKRNNNMFHDEKPSENKERILDMVVTALKDSNWEKPKNEVMEKIKRKFDESVVKGEIINNLLDFLHYYDEPFPMYINPKNLRMLLYDTSTCPLFRSNVENASASSKPGIKISEMVRRL